MGHPSISRLRAMSSQRLVLGLPRVLPSLPPSLAPPCSPYVEGRLRATPHSSSLRPAIKPFETLHLDVWGPSSRPGPGRESFFLVVVDDYSCYTTVFPLAKKSNVNSTLIRWLLTTAETRGRRVSCLHCDRGGEFCSGILAGFCREQGIRQSWTLPESPQQNGVAECRIGLVMEIARTSMTHARAPHFLWPYAVRYAAHQLNLWPRVSRPEISPRAVSCVFLGFHEDSSDYTFYHPPLHWFFYSRDVRFDDSVPYYVRYPCRGLSVPPAPLFLTSAPPLAPPVQPPPPGPAPSSVSHTTPPPSVAPQVKRPPGSPPVFKARYVARGFSQRKGVDFFQTIAPTPKMTTLRWHDTLRSTLSVLGFQPSSADLSLFVRRGSTPFFVLVYVDDLVFATTDRIALANVKLELQKRHTCTDLGELRHYLGLQITRDRAARTITLSQSHMVQQVLQRFELQHSTVQLTPLAVDHRLTGPFPDEPFEPSGPYAELVGCLIYLMTCTRPDLAFPLSILARFVAPGRHRPVHWTAAVRVVKYLATTSGVRLVLGGRQDVVLTAVSWRSTRSSSVSTSTAESEIYAGAMAAQELRWLTFLLTDLSERPSSAPTLFADNKATILLCREP
ncbi:unnamed protein product [Closterium sp. NIES-53]